jgi:ribosomal protein S18 acetylase RimI-like enzyme
MRPNQTVGADCVSFFPLSAAFIHAHAAEVTSVAADIPREYWTLDNFLLELPRKWELSFYASVAGQLIGYAIASEKPPVHLHHLGLHVRWRNRGLGSLMLAELKRRAAGVITLKVAADNIAAQQFYRRHGSAEIGQSGDYVLLSLP